MPPQGADEIRDSPKERLAPRIPSLSMSNQFLKEFEILPKPGVIILNDQIF